MAYSSITKPSLHFNTKLYTGNEAVTTHTGLGFQPDWCWIKDRTQANHNHNLIDAVRAAPNIIMSDNTTSQITDSTDGFTAFASDGFTLGANTSGTQSYELNKNGNNYVAWNWKGNGAGSTNTSGSINSTVSVNTTAGFSIVKWTGDNSSVGTIGHGLGVAPSFYVVKRLDATDNWYAYSKFVGNTKVLYLDLTNSQSGASINYWNNTDPTTTVFTVGDAFRSTGNYIAYCFADKKGYSKFGKYTGNGNADGTFVYTGFKPAFTFLKRTDATGGWIAVDNKRDTFNVAGNFLYPNDNGAEQDLRTSHTPLDFLSNGMKMRSSNLTGTTSLNISDATYIYWAFAEEPLVANVGSSIPATAR